ncbi:transporter substrate-binding domain-containing protein [Galbibacter sp. BG1]|uniref:transglycosylase SLT domain-containing protein n=1 Tax=Galbibacter sp. BG1 TaxID=1170699 RepID=UPI0015BB56AE|nr:transporter substrate-binding domain-containing protein [Galbibacter sp. BG1]QLE00035.1 transporter substrate-binding domain-containing protein [Galbibacter sp. BG1]
MRRYFFLLCVLLFSCETESSSNKNKSVDTETLDTLPSAKEAQKEIVYRDLDAIKEEGILRALVVYSSTSYFLYRGQTMGFEYELLKGLAEDLGVKLEVKIVDNLNHLIDALLAGEGDIIAHGLTISSERKEKVAFSDYLYLTKQVLVQKKPDNWRTLNWAKLDRALIHDPMELLGDTVSVRKNTAYFQRIKNLSEELGGTIHIDTIKGSYSTDEVMEKVSNGEVKYTVADDYLANLQASYYSNLDVSVPVSFSQRIAWAVRPSSKNLLAEVNNWVVRIRKDVDYIVTYRKYFKNTRSFNRRIKSDFFSLNTNEISPYDDIIKKGADYLEWDWRLLSSLIYQESRFDPTTTSWAGAMGLMQLMPGTANDMGVDNITDPTENITGGSKYLKKLYDYYNFIPDAEQRIKFTMAAYDCGFRHIEDAITLTKMNGLDKNTWDNNVENMLLALSKEENYRKEGIKYGYVKGTEPYNYVESIFRRYDHYQDFIK